MSASKITQSLQVVNSIVFSMLESKNSAYLKWQPKAYRCIAIMVSGQAG